MQPTANFSNNGLPYSAATYYTYDIHGNVDVLLQHYNDGIMQTVAGNAFKRIEYKYDLISGKVNEVAYQAGVKDQFYHRYEYDAENKLIKAETSNDYVFWQQQATYKYYRHGPLARTEIGQLGVQGTDYVYTLQGWLKGVNSTAASPNPSAGGGYDPGNDGSSGGRSARDAYGFSLNYNTTDYKAINSGVLPYAAGTFNLTNTDLATTAKPLFNGNIAAMAVSIPKLGNPHVYGYKYDQLNRIVSMDAFTGINSSNVFTAAATANYKERVSYDANGNIQTYTRNGSTAGGSQQTMDILTYGYNLSGGNLINNRLRHVKDLVADDYYSTDIDDQNDDNYGYDEIGNLTKDTKEGIGSNGITWTVYGKIASINKTNGTVINYTYDASGNRISKKVGSKTTFYVRDANGNVMAIYENGNNEINGGKLSQIEVDLYGSSRLGIWQANRDVESTNWGLFDKTPMAGTNGGITALIKRGTTTYELSNHLGNVLVTVSDRKIQVQDPNNSAQTLHYNADVVTATDYFPFGMELPNRTFGNAGRYGFNGKERDKDLHSLTAYDYGFRIYNPALGRFLSVDPLMQSYPWYTPFQFAGNTPIVAIDLDGLEEKVVTNYYDKNGKPTETVISILTNKRGKSVNQKLKKEDGTYVAENMVLVRNVSFEGNTSYTHQSSLNKQQNEIVEKATRQIIKGPVVYSVHYGGDDPPVTASKDIGELLISEKKDFNQKDYILSCFSSKNIIKPSIPKVTPLKEAGKLLLPERSIISSTILFHHDSPELESDPTKEINKIVSMVKASNVSDYSIEILGNFLNGQDFDRTSNYLRNHTKFKNIGEVIIARANAIKELLVQQGLDPSKIKTDYGDPNKGMTADYRIIITPVK